MITMNMKQIKTIALLGFFMISMPMGAIKHEIDASVVETCNNIADSIKVASSTLSAISKDLSDKNMINYAITKSGYAGAGVASVGLGLWCAKEAIKDFRTVIFSKEGIKEAFGKPTAIDSSLSGEERKKAEEEANKFKQRKQWLFLNPILAIGFTTLGILAMKHNPTMPDKPAEPKKILAANKPEVITAAPAPIKQDYSQSKSLLSDWI